jgi:hypothetical protein
MWRRPRGSTPTRPIGRAVLWLVLVAGFAGAAYWVFAPRNPLRVQLLDVTGYADAQSGWMPFRVTVGLTNTGRDLVTVRRIHAEPDFDDFNEAYNVGTYEIIPAIIVEPGGRVSYQAAVTLLNATQLSWSRHPLVLRIRVEQNDSERVYEFPAEFDHAEQPEQRAFRY